jgi:hypothetical protein
MCEKGNACDSENENQNQHPRFQHGHPTSRERIWFFVGLFILRAHFTISIVGLCCFEKKKID